MKCTFQSVLAVTFYSVPLSRRAVVLALYNISVLYQHPLRIKCLHVNLFEISPSLPSVAEIIYRSSYFQVSKQSIGVLSKSKCARHFTIRKGGHYFRSARSYHHLLHLFYSYQTVASFGDAFYCLDCLLH